MIQGLLTRAPLEFDSKARHLPIKGLAAYSEVFCYSSYDTIGLRQGFHQVMTLQRVVCGNLYTLVLTVLRSNRTQVEVLNRDFTALIYQRGSLQAIL